MLEATASDEEAIRAVLEAEGRLMVAQDIDALMRLWAEASRVTDAKNTAENKADDQSWEGKDAIRHRYVRTVFPGAPTLAQPTDLQIEIQGDNAAVRATTQINAEISPGGDLWTLVKVAGCWLLESLTYNLEAAQ
jgi:ketosteroid isomerase-like protein